MGAPFPEGRQSVRVVLDTNTVISALLFPRGALAWLPEAWIAGRIVPLVCGDTVRELIAALAYPKFGLAEDDIHALLAAYVPWTASVEVPAGAGLGVPTCRDPDDQVFLRLVAAGDATVVVTGHRALLEVAGMAPFAIETPATFRARVDRR